MTLNRTVEHNPAPQREWMTLNSEFKKQGLALLHQQCWCWGCDVRRHVEGQRANLLLDLGFERTPPPHSKRGATTYQKRCASGDIVSLWGFGLCFGDARGGIFVSRFAFFPRLGVHASPVEAYRRTHLGDFQAPNSLRGCQRALDYLERAMLWIADYERQVTNLIGSDHREQSLTQWPHTASSARTIAECWENLARQAPAQARYWRRENSTTREVN